MEKVYQTENLVLKVLNKTHAELVLDYYLRNKEFLKEWEPIKSDGFYTVECHQQQLEKESINVKNKDSLRLWIFKKDDDKRIIGCIAFTNIVMGAFLSCYLGYKLDKDEINK
ncbi:GNAT family protein [Tepidibacter aestuarii]|uniref:hypothetical protein n=1 Tax=Tepidibacter aestuarii TaxID=2925782 RepID=UPI002ECFBED8